MLPTGDLSCKDIGEPVRLRTTSVPPEDTLGGRCFRLDFAQRLLPGRYLPSETAIWDRNCRLRPHSRQLGDSTVCVRPEVHSREVPSTSKWEGKRPGLVAGVNENFGIKGDH